MKTSELFVKCLEAEGVEFIFGIPGEENIELLNALSSSGIRFILTRDERWAAFMANAYGRLSGKPGVCLSTLGPGATNLITGVADAFLDFSPLIAITGQVGLKKLHKESHQYLDILSALKPFTKWNTRIEDPDTTPEIIRKAFKISSFEKSGPVHIELPEDVASLEAEGNPIPHDPIRYPEVSEDSLLNAISLMKDSKMPLILAGNGIIRGRATKEFRDFVCKTKIGVTTTFMGMGALPADDECFISTVGLQSKDYISCGFDRADLIITVGYDPVEFAPRLWNQDVRKKIIHINFSPSETDAYYPATDLTGDIKTTLSLLAERVDSAKDTSFYHTLKLYADHGLHFSTHGFPLKPLRIINDIRKTIGRDDILISDVGAHKLWIARFFPAYGENSVVISNGLASMGFALPSAISAKLLYPDKNVIAVAGDGGFLMSMCELNTAMSLGINFVCLIFNDGGYGLIEWKEKLRYKKDFFVKFHNPDFVKLAESFGAKGYRISSEDELFPVLEESLKQSLPVIIDCPVDYSENLRLTEKLGKLICPV
jgi:acetolactate synthase I/II/III large subunit